jgi:DNA-binding transcriptional regulator YiaG
MDKVTFREIRQQLGLSQSELANTLGIHPVTVSHWERGARPITKMADLALWALVFYQERRARRPPGGAGEG